MRSTASDEYPRCRELCNDAVNSAQLCCARGRFVVRASCQKRTSSRAVVGRVWNHRRRDARRLDGTVVAEAAGTYAAILKHPFLAGLTDGSLDPELFTHYVVQDAHYLRDFARAQTVVGSKAPTLAGVGMLARHAAGTAEVELALHESLLSELGIHDIMPCQSRQPPAPIRVTCWPPLTAAPSPRGSLRCCRVLDLCRGGRRAR